MKRIIDINHCLLLENEIYKATTYLPNLVFKKEYNSYFFFSDSVVRCSSEYDGFAECIINFAKESNTSNFIASYLRDITNSYKYQFLIGDTSEDYIYAMNFEIPGSIISLNSPTFSDGIGIYSESKEWAIYSQEDLEISILGSYKRYIPLIVKCFKGLILTSEEIKSEIKLAYHSSNYDAYERDIQQIFKNYNPLSV